MKFWQSATLLTFSFVCTWSEAAHLTSLTNRTFYLPPDPKYTIVDSVKDSVSFTLNRTLNLDAQGHLVSKSSFLNPQGEIMHWHDFAVLTTANSTV